MKPYLFLFFISVALFLLSCSNNKYEATIANYIQSDHKGRVYDLDFKIIDLTQVVKITVQDSIDIFFQQKEDKIKRLEDKIAEDIEKMNTTKTTVWNAYAMKVLKHRIESNTKKSEEIKAIDPRTMRNYDKRDPDDLLALRVRCTYSYLHPLSQTKVTETGEYVLSPDGNRVYHARLVKNIE